MSEIVRIAEEWNRIYRAGGRAALATVIRTHGSTFRRPGARMLILEDGSTVGSVSGGCLESSIIDAAAEVIETGRSRTLRYDGARDDVVLGEGAMCDGEVAITVEKIDDILSKGLEHLIESIQSDDVTIAVGEDDARGPVTRIGKAAERVPDDRVLFRERVHAPLELILCGAGALADAVARLAQSLGWKPLIVDHRPHFLQAMSVATAEIRTADELGALLAKPARTAIVIMTHHYERDLSLVEKALDARPLYVGLLGSRGRSRRLASELKELTPGLETSRLHAPVGLEIGSETIEEIALSIVAEIQAVRRGAPGGSLRESDSPVHGRLSARLAGIILAAGGSTRMGEPKLLLDGPGGAPMILEAIENLKALELNDLIIVQKPDSAIAEIAAVPGVRSVINDAWEEGVSSSIRIAVESLGKDIDGALILLGDQPRITRTDLETLIETWRGSSANAVASVYPEGGGVPAVFSRILFDELRRLEGDRGARELIRSLENVELVRIGDTRDVDDAASYEEVVGRDEM
ncbi:MAG: NTP transferase domain-containing protein [Thermoanaerobaculia bacterium]|nr:NTP transferase domain-containing protein [Thermoanaerobaculia bacterium]